MSRPKKEGFYWFKWAPVRGFKDFFLWRPVFVRMTGPDRFVFHVQGDLKEYKVEKCRAGDFGPEIHPPPDWNKIPS